MNRTGALSSLSPSSRESVDPIAELLSQLSGVRRTTGSSSSNTPSQLQQLQMQLQLERQQVNISRHQMERIPRRQAHSSQTASRDTISNTDSNTAHTVMLKPSVSIAQSSSTVSSPTLPSNFLLAGVLEEMSHHNITDEERSERSRFVQQLVLSTIVKKSDNDESSSKEAVKSLSDCFV